MDPAREGGLGVHGGIRADHGASMVFFKSGAFERVTKGISPPRTIVFFAVPMVAQLILPFASYLLLGLGAQRFRRRLRAARFAACPRCLYDLRDLRRKGRVRSVGVQFRRRGR